MTKPVRILFHVDSMGLGGVAGKVAQLALSLDRQEFEPIVSWSCKPGVWGDKLKAAGIHVVEIVPQAARVKGVGKAIRQIREIAPDIFHTFSYRQNADDVLAAERAGVPVIISARDNVRHWASEGPARNWEFERNRKTHFITPCCKATADLSRKLEGIDPSRMVTIVNGVKPAIEFEGVSVRSQLGLDTGAFLIGYAADYRKLKGHEVLLRAFRKVVDRYPEAHLVCCGADEDELKDKLVSIVAGLGLIDHVTLLGPVTEMASFYTALDLYVHPSLCEGLSLSILEAMSYALPVVATAVGGTGEAVVDGLTGLLAPKREPARLSEAMLELIESPDLRITMGKNGRNRVEEQFRFERMSEAIQMLYRRAAFPATEEPTFTASLFTGTEACPELTDTIVFVSTIGDEVNFKDCLAHLQAQTVRCPVVILDRVAPMSKAFQLMHDLCKKPYYVQVDEDMLLEPHAIQTLHDLIEGAPKDVAFACAPLWDCDIESPILGVKIYRHEIVVKFPYRNTISCEVEQMNQMRAAGYSTLLQSTGGDAACLGEHGKHYTPRTAFQRWQRLFHKNNQMGHLTWLAPWPERLLERYMQTRDRVHLYAALGAIAGIGSRAEANRELDWRDANPALERMQFYFEKSWEPSK